MMLIRTLATLIFTMLAGLFPPNLVLAQPNLLSSNTIDIAVGDWSPYISTSEPFKGVLSHIVTESYKLQNTNVQYHFIGWNEAYRGLQSLDFPVSIGWIKNEPRTQEMYFSDPITHVTLSFFHHRNLNFTWKTLEDLEPYKIATVKGFNYGDKFSEAINARHLQIFEFEDATDAFNALLNHKVDLVPSDILVGKSLLSSLSKNENRSIVTDERPLLVTPVHMIANLKNSKGITLVDRFNKGLRQLNQRGRLKRILANTKLINAIHDLSFLTEENAPLNYVEDGEIKGVSVAIMSRILEEIESDIGLKDFKVQPWARAYFSLLKNDKTVLFSIAKTLEREDKFQWVGPIYRTNVVLFANPSINHHGASITDYSDHTICAVREDVGAQALANQQHPPKKIHLVPTAEQCARMLQLGRVSYWAYGEDTGQWHLKKIGADHNDYKKVLQLQEAFRYIAISKDVSREVVNTFQVTLDYLRMTGQLQRIIEEELSLSKPMGHH